MCRLNFRNHSETANASLSTLLRSALFYDLYLVTGYTKCLGCINGESVAGGREIIVGGAL